jgi:hypothetical protein
MASNNMFANLNLKKEKPIAASVIVREKRGKSSDPNYNQTTIYLRKDIAKQAQVKLIEEEFDFSDLINDLVQNWVNKKNP